MKKIISLVLVFCMLFSLGVSAFADDQGESLIHTESGGGESGGGSGGGESGGGSSGGESGGGSSGGESGGASGGGESGGASGGGESGNAQPTETGGSGGSETGGGSGGGTGTEPVGNVYADDDEDYISVGGTEVTFDNSGQGSIPQVTKDKSGVHIDANVNGSDIAVEVNGSMIVNISGDINVAGNDSTGVVASGGSTVNTGDIISEYSGVSATGGSTVEVGSVSASGYGIEAEKSTVIVNGDVKMTYCDYYGVYANGRKTTVTVNGDVISDTDGVMSVDSAVVNVTGDVSGNDRGVYANYGNVTVEGTVTSTNGFGVFAQEESTVNAGDVTSTNGTGIHAESGSTVTSGTVTAGDIGIHAESGSTVTSGDVTGGSTGISASKSTVEVDGDVIGEYGSGVIANDSTVEVSGDVTGAKIGISVQIEGDTAAKQSTVIVEGTVKATEENGYTIELNVPEGASLETVKDVLPEIVVQSIDSKADYVVCTGDTSDQKRENIATAVLESIKYIVETEAKNTDGSDSTVTVDLVRYNTEEAVETKDLLNADGTTKKTLTVATTSTQLVVAVDKTKGSVVGVTVGNEKSASNPDGNVITHDEDKDQWIITVGIGGGLKVIATIDKPAPEPVPEPEPGPDPVKPDPSPRSENPSPRSETVPVRPETVSTGLVKLDYGHKNPLENILIIDMRTTNVAVLLTHTLRTFNRRNAIGTVMIKMANGSFVIPASGLLQLLGSEAACALIASGDMLEIRVGGETVASLVITSTK